MRRLDGIYTFVSNPEVRKKTCRFGVISLILAIVFGLISNVSLPSRTLGESGAASNARLWSSGAELNTTTADIEVSGTSGTMSISNSTKRSGDYAYRVNPASSTGSFYKTWANSAQSNKFWFRTYFRMADDPSATTYIFKVGGGASGKISVQLNNSTNTLQLRNEEDNANIGSVSTALVIDTWYRIELFVDTTTLSSTDTELRLDGVLVASSTAENIAAAIDRLTWGSSVSGTTDMFFDDIAINDSTGRSDNWPGEGKIVHMNPDADGDNVAWTASAGSDYATIDEVTPDTADYIHSQTINQIEDVNLETSSNAGITAGDTVKLVSVGLHLRACGTPGEFSCLGTENDPTYNVRVKAAASGTVDDGSTITLANNTTYYTNDDDTAHLNGLTTYDLPGTSTAKWNTTDLDTAQIGVKNTDVDGTGFRVATIWLQVEYVAGADGRMFSSGFELNSATANIEWPTINGSPTISSTTFRSGLYAGRISSLSSGTRMAFGYNFKAANANGPFWLRTYFRATTLPSAENRIIDLRDSGSTARVYLTVDNTGVLKLYDEDGQVAGTSTLSTGVWYRLEVKIDASGAGANDTVEAKVNGAAAFATSATRDLTNGVTQFGLGGNLNSEAQTTGDWFFDDVGINENIGSTQNSYPGDGNIIHLQPNGNDATNTAWANDYTNVDEITPNDATDLISETTTNDTEDYDLTNSAVGASDTVNLVSVGVRFNTSSATKEDFRIRLKASSSDTAIESPILSPASTTWVTNQTAAPYAYPLNAYTRSGLTSAWTDTQLDTAQVGVRDTGGAGTIQVSTLWLLIDYTVAPIIISGTCDQFDQTTDCVDDGSNAIKFAVNGTIQAQTDTTVDGSWSISGVTPPAANDIITVFIDANADINEAVAVTKYDGSGDITSVQLFQRHLSIGSDDDQTVSNTNLSQYDNSVSGDEDIFFDVSAGDDLTVDSVATYTDEELYIASGDTYRPASGGGADATTVHVEIDGTWTADNNAITVNGNWQNDSTFTGGTSTATFNATATGKTLAGTMTGASGKFYNLTFNGVSGGWTFSNAVETSNSFQVVNGAVTGNGQSLTVANDFTLDNTTGVSYVSGVATVTIGDDISNAGAKATWTATSTVAMTGTSDGISTMTGLTSSNTFSNLNIGYSGTTTATTTAVIRASGTVTVKGGTVSGTSGYAELRPSGASSTPLVIDSGSSFTGTKTYYFVPLATPHTLTLPTANADFGTWSIAPYAAFNNLIFKLGMNTTTTGTFSPQADVGITGSVVDTDTTNNYTMTAATLDIANCSPSRTGGWTVYMRGSTSHSFTSTTSSIIVGSNCGAHTLDMGSSTVSVKGAVSLENGTGTITVTPGTGTLKWTHTSGSKTFTPSGESFYNITLDCSGGTVAPGAAVVVTNDLTMTAGILSSSSNVTVNGSTVGVAGTFSYSGSAIHEQRVAAAKTFGTTSGSTDWSFVNLRFTNSSGSPATVSTNTGGTGGVTITSVMTVGLGSDSARTILDAGNRTWTLSGTGGDPLVIDVATNASRITGATSTFTYSGANGAGNTTVEKNTSGTYYNLRIGGVPLCTNDTYVLEGAIDVDNDLTIQSCGTLDTVSGSNHAITVGNSYTNSGVLTANSGTITMDATDSGNTLSGTLSGASAFYNLTFNGVGGIWSMSAASTISNNLAITNGTLEDNGSQITGNGAGTFTMASGTTLKLGTGTATVFPSSFTNGNTTLNAASTVVYNARIAQNISGTPTYGNLQLSRASGTPTKSLLAATVVAGSVTIDASNTLDVDNAGNFGLTIAKNYTNNGTFTARAGTVTFNGTTTGYTLSGTLNSTSAFYNLTFNGSGGEWTPGAATAVTNDLTMTAGSLLGTNNVTVNGAVAGTAGIINLTGGTFEQRVGTAKNFGTTSSSTVWTFASLTFSNSAGVSSTVTTQTGGSGGITVSSVMKVGLATDTARTVLAAGNRTWTLSGTGGDPLQIDIVTNGSRITGITSTFSYTGANGSGDTTIEKNSSASFNNLTVNASDTFVLEGTTTVGGNLTIISGTLDAVSGSNHPLLVGGNWSNSGTFTARSGTVTLNGSAAQTLSGTMTGSSAFYNLTLSNTMSLPDTDCERTGFTATVDFNAAATATNAYAITGNAAVEYESGAAYTFNNINWDNSGNRYFRNSLTSGTWLLNVTAAGNAQTKVTNVNVSRSDASRGALIIASDGTNTNCGNNTNWQFDETLSLSYDSTSKTFGTLSPGANPSDQTSTLTATSNGTSGYTIYGWTTQAMTSNRISAETISDWTGTNGTPTTFSAGSYGFGYSTDDVTLTGGTNNRFSGPKYAGFTHTGPGDPVADRTAPVTGATNTINYRLYPTTTQADGDYSTVIVYVITANFP